ncbi:DUF6318 family protein [uncultured Aeromicrobium sp.]|uniref:DUF6318 family protein n=1 Tax=uncultured Aeromicrobium sp. TaxID=337820 RepID=UPI0025DC5D05|nr:DUF6318 family protein [uncultured Aeromicrobium sp.]
MIRRLALALLAAALLLTGCSGSPGEEEPTAGATAAPMDAPPTMPELALDDSPAGAEAFVRHWVDVFNAAARSGEGEWLERLSSPNCSPCKSYAREFQKLADEERSPSTAIWSLKADHMEAFEDGARTFVKAPVDVREGETTEQYVFVFYIAAKGPERMLDITMEPR